MLFKKSDIPENIIEPESNDGFDFDMQPVSSQGDSSCFLSSKTSKLSSVFGKVEKDTTYHIATRGNWSSPHLIEHLLSQIGPAKCYLTSWSVKEQAVRILMLLMDTGKITELHALFDERIKVNCPQAYQLAESNIADIRLTKIHAKMVVLMNDDWGISISTSANLTRNPRIEKFVISTHMHVARFDKDWIDAELRQSQPFDE
jgi:hypothetical protein